MAHFKNLFHMLFDIILQAEYALYTAGLDENRGSSDFVHDFWICYKVQCTKFCTLHFITYPDVVYKVATAAFLIQTRGVQSVFSLEMLFTITKVHSC